jgi:hypothetical protein
MLALKPLPGLHAAPMCSRSSGFLVCTPRRYALALEPAIGEIACWR